MADFCFDCRRDYTVIRHPVTRTCGHTSCRECVIKQRQSRRQCHACFMKQIGLREPRESLTEPAEGVPATSLTTEPSSPSSRMTGAGSTQRKSGIPTFADTKRRSDNPGAVFNKVSNSIPGVHTSRVPPPTIYDRRGATSHTDLQKGSRACDKVGSVEARAEQNPSIRNFINKYEQLAHKSGQPSNLLPNKEHVGGNRRYQISGQVSREDAADGHYNKQGTALKHLSKSTGELNILLLEKTPNTTSGNSQGRQGRFYGSRDELNQGITERRTIPSLLKQPSSTEHMFGTRTMTKPRVLAQRSSSHDGRAEADNISVNIRRPTSLKRPNSLEGLDNTNRELPNKLHLRRGSLGRLYNHEPTTMYTPRKASHTELSIEGDKPSKFTRNVKPGYAAQHSSSTNSKSANINSTNISNSTTNSSTTTTTSNSSSTSNSNNSSSNNSSSNTSHNPTQQEVSMETAGIHAARPIIIVESRDPLSTLDDDNWETQEQQQVTAILKAEDYKRIISALKTELRSVTHKKESAEKDCLSIQEELKQTRKEVIKGKTEQLVLRQELTKLEHLVTTQDTHIANMEQEIQELKRPSSSGGERLREEVEEELRSKEHQWLSERLDKERTIEALQLELRETRQQLQQYHQQEDLVGELKHQLTKSEHEISILKVQLREKETETRRYRALASKSPLALQREAPVGLPNFGNTCYINSIIQCLYSIQALRQYFISEKYKKDLNNMSEQKGEVALSLAEVFQALNSGTKTDESIRKFKKVMAKHDSEFEGHDQQEAHDLFLALLQCLHNDLSKSSNNEQINDHHSNSTSFIASIFYGVQKSVIYCREKKITVYSSTESFNNLTLSVLGTEEHKLGELLKNHLRPQEIDWDCQHCRQLHKCVHYTSISKLPFVLSLHFSRYGNSSHRNNHKGRVLFPPDNLSLGKDVAQVDYPSVYQLISVCNHHGTMTSGHYTAFCRRKKGSGGSQWWMMDDLDAHPATVQDAIAERDAHIVFYETVQDSFV
ncbi:ubiquitin carboxyl-terminal hydrolase 8 isoform X3 [Cherax quadricarinatus]|uniref:ubiquitin carboxyl-terminal hydrolase 8 isoform X3 n=1 Tax=Cherax quadricarinatus TaxID=27406 RepID=UPI00387E5860